MEYRLLLDEHIEHEVCNRLENAGHDVKHIDWMGDLEKGASDEALATYSVTTDRTIVTYDDDFIETVPPTKYRAVLFFEDDTLPPETVAEIIHAMTQVYPHEEVTGLQKTGRAWL